MKKIILGLLLVGSLSAKDNVYIGASYSYDMFQHTDDYTEQEVDGSSIYTSFTIGKYFGDYRVHLDLSSSNSIGISADYMFNLQESDFTPFVGTSVYYSYNSRKYSGDSKTKYYTNDDYSFESLSLGVQLGFTHPINEDFEFETSLLVGRVIVSGKNDLNYQSLSIGINYLF